MGSLPPLIKHDFASPVPDTADANKVGSARWNKSLSVFLGTVCEALSKLDLSGDKLAYFDGVDSAKLTTLTSFARLVLASETDTAARIVLGAVGVTGDVMSGSLDMGGNRVTGLAVPVNPSDAARKAEVDAVVAAVTGALIFKGGFTASAGSFAAIATGAKKGWFWKIDGAGTVDGVSFSVGDDVFALVDNPSPTTYAGNWLKVEGSITAAEIVAALGYTPANVASPNFTNSASVDGYSSIKAPAAGVFTLLNYAGTNFDRLQFGGMSSAFPAIRRSGASLEAILSDASAYARFAAGYLVSYGNVEVAGGGIIYWLGRSQLWSDVNGNIRLTNTDQSGFNLLQFGGATNAFPSLKRSGSELHLRLADDSAYGVLRLNNVVAQDGVWLTQSFMKSPASGVITLYDVNVSDFYRLQFGGTTSAFPSLKRAGAALHARLADDSNYTNFYGDHIVAASGSVWSNGSFIFDGNRGFMGAPANGYIVLCNAAGNDFYALQFGGSSSAFPEIKRSGTALQARLADDSDWAPMACKTPAPGTNDNSVATMAAVNTAIAAGGGVPGIPIPTSSALPVGSVAQLYNDSAGTVAAGATCAGSGLRNLYMTNSGGTAVFSAVGALQSGTWKNITGYQIANTTCGLFVRTA